MRTDFEPSDWRDDRKTTSLHHTLDARRDMQAARTAALLKLASSPGMRRIALSVSSAAGQTVASEWYDKAEAVAFLIGFAFANSLGCTMTQ